MSEKSGNYQADIHNSSYEDDYLSIRLDHTTLLNSNGRETESLNGKWHFGVDLYDTCRRAKWYTETRYNEKAMEQPVDWDFDAWERITVPGSWNLQRPELLYFEGTGVYFRTFHYIPKVKDERVFLCFEGAAYRASVFFNGEFIGTHDGASTPFSVEITGKIKPENRIIVTTDARRRPDRVPMENTDWFNYGGLYRDICLVRTPKTFIKNYFIHLVPDGTFSKIKVQWTLDGTAGKNDKIGINIPELCINQVVSTKEGEIIFTVDPEELYLWSPENPKLYDVCINYLPEVGSIPDQIYEKIGFREIKTDGETLFLNGKEIFLKGICVHEDHYQLGKTTDPDIIRQTIRDLKEMNGNYFRLAHYPHDRRFAQIADEEGILLWEEVPVYWAIAFENPETYRDAENQLMELIMRDCNRASVIIWSMGNENADTDSRLNFMSGLVKKAKELDNSRLISAACLINHSELKIEDRLAEFLDIIGINEYYGWYDPDFDKLPKILSNSNPGKPVLICEFGGDARTGQRGTVTDLFSEDKQKALYEKQIATFKQCPFIAGLSPWILYDFRCPRRLNRYQEGFNRKGLIDADRTTKKPAFYVMQVFYAEK
ncbi:beta-glucuronidase [Spirochaetia bacterium]|nr:beta-glucuronidase [Spirochaetia bacterium]